MKDYYYDGNKKYEIFVIDEWSNIYEAYFVDELSEAEELLNEFFKNTDTKISEYDEERAGLVPHFGQADTDYSLFEVDTTFGKSIDTISIDCEDGLYQVRGFVFK